MSSFSGCCTVVEGGVYLTRAYFWGRADITSILKNHTRAYFQIRVYFQGNGSNRAIGRCVGDPLDEYTTFNLILFFTFAVITKTPPKLNSAASFVHVHVFFIFKSCFK